MWVDLSFQRLVPTHRLAYVGTITVAFSNSNKDSWFSYKLAVTELPSYKVPLRIASKRSDRCLNSIKNCITHIPYIPTFCVMSRTTGMPTLRTTTPSPSFRGTASTRVQRESEPQRGVEM
ncbi:hypothetical protein J6590_031407 [Homalodisca vitripennis]|nr:hypothetical protein J6590_031407 [Homalodisca vitripennis]